MKRLPLNVQTLYADLAQGVTFSTALPASIYTQTIKDKIYLYAAEKHGGARIQRYLGPHENEDVRRRADEIRRAAQEARLRRKTVSMLKRLGVPAPTLDMGRLMEAIGNAGLFRKGMVLVGTGAYQLYSPILGVALGALTTQDADLAATSLAVTSDFEGESLLDILRRADPSFTPQLGLDRGDLPKRFRSAAGFDVDVLTRYRSRRDDKGTMPVKGLGCGAQPLRYLEYLIEDPITAVALYGSGIAVSVPQPARYAMHKLIVAQVRIEASTKRNKDLAQASEFLEALRISDPQALEDAFEDARRRGAKWRAHIETSLAEIGLSWDTLR